VVVIAASPQKKGFATASLLLNGRPSYPNRQGINKHKVDYAVRIRMRARRNQAG